MKGSCDMSVRHQVIGGEGWPGVGSEHWRSLRWCWNFNEDTVSWPFGGELSTTLTLATKVAHSVDDLQLLLDSSRDVHAIRDVDVSDVTTRHKKVIQFNLMSPAVSIGDVGQADVHESINVVNASSGHALVSKVHSGYLALEALQQDDQAVLRDGPLLHRVAQCHGSTLVGCSLWAGAHR